MNFKKPCPDSIHGGPRFCAQLGPFSIHGRFEWAHFLGPLTNSPCPDSVLLISYHRVLIIFLCQKGVQNSGRPRELEKSKRKANGKQLVSCHAKSRAVTNSWSAHGAVSECERNANADRTQQSASDRSTPVQRVLIASGTVSKRFGKGFPNGSRKIASLPEKIGINVIFDRFNVHLTLVQRFCNVASSLHTSSNASSIGKTQWVILGFRWVSTGFWGCV